MSYKIKLEVFEGPLDLLLYLIKKDEINIYDIPIATITDQYMQYLDMMKLLDLDVVGDFLVMAATLMQIKSKMLLPPDPVEVTPEEEDPREELVRRLLEYKKFKEAAENLHQKAIARQDLFPRVLDEEKTKELKEEATETYFETNLFDLISAFTNALKNVPKDVFYQVIKEEFTVEKKIHDILHLFINHPRVLLRELFEKARSKDEIIVTFMAVLELIRLREVVAMQKGIFGEIEVLRNKENLEPHQDEGQLDPNNDGVTQDLTNDNDLDQHHLKKDSSEGSWRDEPEIPKNDFLSESP